MHTQGPWQSITCKTGHFEIGNAEKKSICIGGNVFGTPEENISNAHLIAVAPDMLFELKTIIKRFEMELEMQPKKYFPGRSHIDDIRRVIQRAEGVL